MSDGGSGEKHDPLLELIEHFRSVVLSGHEATLQLATLYAEQRRRIEVLEAQLAQQTRERKDLHDLVEHLLKKVTASGSRIDTLEIALITGKHAGKG